MPRRGRTVGEKRTFPQAPRHSPASRSDAPGISSSRLANAARTAATVKAENVVCLPAIARSTPSITSFGNRTHLFVVGSATGTLNLIFIPPRTA